MAITLSEIRTQAKRRADMENSGFVSDAEWLDYINGSIATLYDLLVTCYEDYYITTYTFNTVSGTASYSLPSSFYKLKGVDAQFDNAQWENVRKFQFESRNRQQYTSDKVLQYRLLGSNLQLVPTPASVIPFKIWYIPVATKLVTDSDTLADLNQYAEFVIVDAAIKAMLKEESDPSGLIMQRNQLEQRIVSSASQRDENESESITDVHDVIWSID